MSEPSLVPARPAAVGRHAAEPDEPDEIDTPAASDVPPPVSDAPATGRVRATARVAVPGIVASAVARAVVPPVVASHPVVSPDPGRTRSEGMPAWSAADASGAREYRGRRRADHGPDDQAAPKPPGDRDSMALLHTGIRGLGELLITFGLVVLLFAGYEVWGKSAQVDAAQNEMDSRLENEWGAGSGQATPPKEKPLPGDAIARLHIPRLDKRWVVVQGVKPGDIKNGPGHYPETAMPGKIGNFSAAGHRMPAVFWNLHKMQPGDKIFLEDRQNWYEYQVTESKIVLPNAVAVVAPVPGQPGAKPTKAMLTLTTCNPQWDNYERLIVHAELAGTRPKSQGRPPELAKKD